MNTTTHYQVESIVPRWLLADKAYLAGLAEALIMRCEYQGWTVVTETNWQDDTHATDCPVPQGMALITMWVGVHEFEFEIPDDADEPQMVRSYTGMAGTHPEGWEDLGESLGGFLPAQGDEVDLPVEHLAKGQSYEG